MKRTLSTLISALLICCLCAGTTVSAQDPEELDIISGRGGAGFGDCYRR